MYIHVVDTFSHSLEPTNIFTDQKCKKNDDYESWFMIMIHDLVNFNIFL